MLVASLVLGWELETLRCVKQALARLRQCTTGGLPCSMFSLFFHCGFADASSVLQPLHQLDRLVVLDDSMVLDLHVQVVHVDPLGQVESPSRRPCRGVVNHRSAVWGSSRRFWPCSRVGSTAHAAVAPAQWLRQTLQAESCLHLRCVFFQKHIF